MAKTLCVDMLKFKVERESKIITLLLMWLFTLCILVIHCSVLHKM